MPSKRYLAPVRRAEWVVYAKAPVRRTGAGLWSMSAAIHTASPFPTIASLISRIARFASSGRIIVAAASGSR